jgi:hypothetical protein
VVIFTIISESFFFAISFIEVYLHAKEHQFYMQNSEFGMYVCVCSMNLAYISITTTIKI